MSVLCRLRTRSEAVAHELRKVTTPASQPVKTRSDQCRLGTLLRDNEGSTLFETAISSIFMATLLLLIFSIAMGLVAYQQLGYAVMRATQHVAYGRGLLADPCATVANDIAANLITWNPGNFTYTVDITTTSNNVDTDNTFGPYTGASSATCSSAGGTTGTLANATGGAKGNPVTVHVTYIYNWFPIFGDKITGKLASEDTMLVE